MKNVTIGLLISLSCMLAFRVTFDHLVRDNSGTKGKVFTSSDGVRLFYRHIKADTDPRQTILVLPGLGAHSLVGEKLVKSLSSEFNVIVAGRLSYGFSSSDETQISLKNYAKRLGELLDSLDVKEIHVLGLSLGAAYGTVFYRNYPERVVSILNADCSVPEEIDEGEEYVRQILGDWLSSYERLRVASIFGVHQFKTALLYGMGKIPFESVLSAQHTHIESTLLEGGQFWELLEEAQFYDNYKDLPLLVVSSNISPSYDIDQNRPLQYHQKLSRLSSRGYHKVLVDTSHGDLIGDLDGKLSSIYLEFLRSIKTQQKEIALRKEKQTATAINQ